MSLFNFNNNFEDEFEEHEEEIECQCDECSVSHTLEIVNNFTELALQAQKVEHLQQIMYQFAEMAKIQGVKEYLFESVDIKMDTLIGLKHFTDSVYNNQGNQNGYGDNDLPHWEDRL